MASKIWAITKRAEMTQTDKGTEGIKKNNNTDWQSVTCQVNSRSVGNSACFLEKIYYAEVDLPAEQEWKHECERLMQRALLGVAI